jgi:hypothetical protein
MFESLTAATEGTSCAGGVGAWARVENAACARRLAVTADMLEARWAADGSAEREQWCLDNWDAVAAEVAAAQNVSHGVASHQLIVARALRDRLPRVAEVFATGRSRIGWSPRSSRAHGWSKTLRPVPVDAAIAAEVTGGWAVGGRKAEAAIDRWVDRFDLRALRRTGLVARPPPRRDMEDDGAGCHSSRVLYAHDAAV